MSTSKPKINPADRTLTVTYRPTKKAVEWFGLIFMLFFLLMFLSEGLFIIEILVFIAVVAGAHSFSDSLFTREITFSPYGICKKRSFNEVTIPATALLLTANEQTITFYHASRKNFRESCAVRRRLITAEQSADILAYAEEVYGVTPDGSAAEGSTRPNEMAEQEFSRTSGTYLIMGVFFVAYCLIAIFSVGLSANFIGFMSAFPSFPVRFGCMTLAAAGLLLANRISNASDTDTAPMEPLTTRLKQSETKALKPGLIALLIGGMGLALFLMFGNSLDFCVLLLVGWLCYVCCYPRLSTWERIVHRATATETPGIAGNTGLTRRSLRVSLVLMGALTALSYGQSSHYLYTSRKDCVDDWGDGTDCREIPAGSGYHSTYRYYGPRQGSGRAPHAAGVGTVSRGGFGSLGGFHASFGG